jgi:L-lactate dehydrogenase (cytochrome)
VFAKLHAPGTLSSLPPSLCLGPVDVETLPYPADDLSMTEDEKRRQDAREMMPAPEAMHLVQDFEYWAERVLDDMAWAYYRSAADEENST